MPKPIEGQEEEVVVEDKGEDTTTDVADTTEDVVEKSPYEEELARIEAEAAEKVRVAEEALKKANDLVDHKEKQVVKEKEKTKLTKDEWIEEATARMREERKAEKHEDAINALTTDPAARKVVTWHLNNSVLKGPDVDVNVRKAWAIANADQLEALQNAEREEYAAEDRSVSSMGGSSARGYQPSSRVTPATKMADRMSAMIAGKDKERLKNLQRYNRENL